ncbi:MAG: hypothetical protein K6G00_03700 [Treponema sp.]|nr:hypothetical protein [Treponema sp.]
MEKSETRSLRKWSVGLLILLFATVSSYAQWNYESIRNLRFHQKNEYVYSLDNEEFYVDIENVSPNDVSVYMNSIPDNVELVSIKKETYIPPLESTNSSYGTHIVITVRFLKSGNYKLFACDLVVKGNFFKIPFNAVKVFENVQLIKPSLSIGFNINGSNISDAKNISVPAGTHIQYTVYVQFASDIQEISWSIPENSLFEQISEYEIDKIPFSEQSYDVFSKRRPLATFDWCPLSSGVYKLPAVSVEATALNGSSCNLGFPAYTVSVTKGSVEKSFSSKPSFEFSESFEAPDDFSVSSGVKEVSESSIKEYCNLLKDERNSFPVISNAKDKRIEFERLYNLTSYTDIQSRPLFICFIIIVVISIVLGILFCIFRKYSLFLFCVGSLCFFSGVCIFYGLRVNRKYAVVTGGNLMSIPENNTSTGMAIQKGSLLRIKKYAGNWLYVDSHDTSGWIQKDNVIFIE